MSLETELERFREWLKEVKQKEQDLYNSYTKEELYCKLYVFIFAYHETISTGKPYTIPNYKMIADYFKVALNEYDEP